MKAHLIEGLRDGQSQLHNLIVAQCNNQISITNSNVTITLQKKAKVTSLVEIHLARRDGMVAETLTVFTRNNCTLTSIKKRTQPLSSVI